MTFVVVVLACLLAAGFAWVIWKCLVSLLKLGAFLFAIFAAIHLGSFGLHYLQNPSSRGEAHAQIALTANKLQSLYHDYEISFQIAERSTPTERQEESKPLLSWLGL